jgi:putative SOS response-associated peptidase YedK
MCGRIAQVLPPAKAAEIFDVSEALPNAAPLFNAPPSSQLMVVRQHPRTGARHLDLLRWGLVPHWAKDAAGAAGLSNARAETVADKPSFRSAVQAGRRCLVPADAFYEWHRDGAVKQPYAIAYADGAPMAFAGLWDNWRDPASGLWTRTFTVLTQAACAPIDSIHHRMPVMLGSEQQKQWLCPGPLVLDQLRPLTAALSMWPVSPRVNSVKNNDAALLERVDPGTLPAD